MNHREPLTDTVSPVCPCGRAFKSIKALGCHARACAKATPEVRFWLKVDRSGGPVACWIWKGAVTSKWAYGCVQWKGRVLGAHKVAWMLTNGPVPEGLCVLHKCDNRVCVNPAHFFLGTKLDNVQDMYAKGRDGCKGEKNVHARLTEAQAREALSLRGKATGKELAARYGVKRQVIYALWQGRAWRYLHPPEAQEQLRQRWQR